MAIYTNLPVYEDCYQLLLALVESARRMQRDMRYTIGEQLKHLTTDMIVLIYKANATADKRQHISLAREKLVEIRVLLRILSDTKQLSDKQFMLYAERTASISKQLAAWEKYVEKRKTEASGQRDEKEETNR